MDSQHNIALQKIPFEGDDRPESKRNKEDYCGCNKNTREQNSNSRVSSLRISLEEFLAYQDKQLLLLRLLSDEIGIILIPSIHAASTVNVKEGEWPRRVCSIT
jgi:hypothetical protein